MPACGAAPTWSTAVAQFASLPLPAAMPAQCVPCSSAPRRLAADLVVARAVRVGQAERGVDHRGGVQPTVVEPGEVGSRRRGCRGPRGGRLPRRVGLCDRHARHRILRVRALCPVVPQACAVGAGRVAQPIVRDVEHRIDDADEHAVALESGRVQRTRRMHVVGLALRAGLFDRRQQHARRAQPAARRLSGELVDLRARGDDREDVLRLRAHLDAQCLEVMPVAGVVGDGANSHRLAQDRDHRGQVARQLRLGRQLQRQRNGGRGPRLQRRCQ